MKLSHKKHLEDIEDYKMKQEMHEEDVRNAVEDFKQETEQVKQKLNNMKRLNGSLLNELDELKLQFNGK